jgi:hypothetical protein
VAAAPPNRAMSGPAGGCSLRATISFLTDCAGFAGSVLSRLQWAFSILRILPEFRTVVVDESYMARASNDCVTAPEKRLTKAPDPVSSAADHPGRSSADRCSADGRWGRSSFEAPTRRFGTDQQSQRKSECLQ